MKIPSTPMRVAALAIVALVSGRLPAQDVTVGEPGWFKADGTSIELPRAHWRLRPEYPDALRKTDETGYVILARYLDAESESRGLGMQGTHPWFIRAVEEVLFDLRFTPARRDGQPVASSFWIPIIFNSASTAVDRSEAKPRLLAVAPVIAPPAILAKLGRDTTVWGMVSLDETGGPRKVALESPADDQLLPFVEAALKQWRFTPARQGGQPVAADFRVAFFFFPAMAPVPTNVIPPHVVRREDPVYPVRMRMSHLQGEVVLKLVVNEKGEVVNPVVVRSDNSAFDQPAIEAMLQWKYDPRTVDGHPVSTQLSEHIVFRFDNGRGREVWKVDSPSSGAQAKTPEEFRYDVAPKPRGMTAPVYPYPLLRENTKGRATVMFQISPEGRVVGRKIAEATHPEFGLALAAAAETYEFTPALKDGKPTATVLKTEQEFNPVGFHSIVSRADWSLLKREKDKPESIIDADKLDVPLKPISRHAPVFPPALRGQGQAGTARIEVLVDEEGHTHLPRIAEASDPAFGYAAVQAASQWLFEPPKARGKPVVARVTIPFDFATKPPVLGTAVGEEK